MEPSPRVPACEKNATTKGTLAVLPVRVRVITQFDSRMHRVTLFLILTIQVSHKSERIRECYCF